MATPSGKQNCYAIAFCHTACSLNGSIPGRGQVAQQTCPGSGGPLSGPQSLDRLVELDDGFEHAPNDNGIELLRTVFFMGSCNSVSGTGPSRSAPDALRAQSW
jgi:hypothetical protein